MSYEWLKTYNTSILRSIHFSLAYAKLFSNQNNRPYRVSHETWHLKNSLKCLLQQLVKLFDIKRKMKNIVCQLYYCKIDNKVKYIWEKDVFNEMTCKKSLISNMIYGRRHSKLFKNCHVSWDTLYIIQNLRNRSHILSEFFILYENCILNNIS